LWGISPEKLSSEFAKQRIKDFSLGEAIKQLFFKKNRHKTLVDQFAYPIGGNGYVYEKMKGLYVNNGGKIFFNTKITSIVSQKNTFEVMFEGFPAQKFDYVISSMPIDNFLNLFKNYTKKIPGLKFRNTILVYSNIKSENIFEDQWLYIQEEKVKAGRITNFNNWVDNIKNNKSGTVLVNEYWANEEDPLWSCSDNELHAICSDDLISCGFLKSKSEILEYKVVRVPKCYPIYVGDYKYELSKIQSFIDGFDKLQLIGRYGSFKYNNQDHSILMGILAAENITDGANNNIWEINTDYKYHESSTISETGLIEDKDVV
jgi:protoporphyrinogen oxidase